MTNPPTDQDLPSTRQLVRSTIVAALVAAVLLVCVVMPAEYGIDYTGVGDALGLKRMGEIKASLESEQPPTPGQVTTTPVVVAQTPAGPQAPLASKESVHITLLPDQGREVKLAMPKGGVAQYTWRSSGDEVFFDLHADSRAQGIDYHGYQKGTAQQESGVLTAAFEGAHGWFWRNRSPDVLVITLDVEGEFSSVTEH